MVETVLQWSGESNGGYGVSKARKGGQRDGAMQRARYREDTHYIFGALGGRRGSVSIALKGGGGGEDAATD